MGCNCKKKEPVSVFSPIQTPEPIKELTQEEIDSLNNIDEINPIEDDE